jgi:methylated-DNA-[protein]-cysteine S-methyltransferase
VALLAGRSADLGDVMLDMDGVTPFRRQVYEAARAIPAGLAVGYADLARRIGAPDATRAIGRALAHNPFPIVVPCHRVLVAGGKVGGFSAAGGVTMKVAMLAAERTSAPWIGRTRLAPPKRTCVLRDFLAPRSARCATLPREVPPAHCHGERWRPTEPP